MSDNLKVTTITTSWNELIEEMFHGLIVLTDEEKALGDRCRKNVFAGGAKGAKISFQSTSVYAQFTPEIMLAAFASEEFREDLIRQLDEEACVTEYTYWDQNMEKKRFGIEGRDYSVDIEDLSEMIRESMDRIDSWCEWMTTTHSGFEMYLGFGLDKKDCDNLNRIICEYPYLIRRFDHDKKFADFIMSQAGYVARQYGDILSVKNK